MKTDPTKICAYRPNGQGQPQVVQTSFGAGPGRLLERLAVVTCALLQHPEAAAPISYVTMNVERHLVLVGSLVPLHLSAEQVQRRLLDAVPAEEPAP